jgi:hypothetical protein
MVPPSWPLLTVLRPPLGTGSVQVSTSPGQEHAGRVRAPMVRNRATLGKRASGSPKDVQSVVRYGCPSALVHVRASTAPLPPSAAPPLERCGSLTTHYAFFVQHRHPDILRFFLLPFLESPLIYCMHTMPTPLTSFGDRPFSARPRPRPRCHPCIGTDTRCPRLTCVTPKKTHVADV